MCVEQHQNCLKSALPYFVKNGLSLSLWHSCSYSLSLSLWHSCSYSLSLALFLLSLFSHFNLSHTLTQTMTNTHTHTRVQFAFPLSLSFSLSPTHHLSLSFKLSLKYILFLSFSISLSLFLSLYLSPGALSHAFLCNPIVGFVCHIRVRGNWNPRALYAGSDKHRNNRLYKIIKKQFFYFFVEILWFG